MYKGKKIVAIIPARGGSKRIPRKNIKLLAGKPLIYYTIKEAKASKYIDRIIVTTDDPEIAEIAKKYGAETPFLRPKQLSGDDIGSDIKVYQHAVNYLEKQEHYHIDFIVELQPTAPLRTAEYIDAAIIKLISTEADSVSSVTPVREHPLLMRKVENDRLVNFISFDKKYTRSQDYPNIYRFNGAIYAVRRNVLMEQNTDIGDDTRVVIMPEELSIDIDTSLDFTFAEVILKKNKKMTDILIGNRRIGDTTFIIAEAGVNHNGKLELAKQLIDAAADAGADAIKFQTFKAESLVSTQAPKEKYQKLLTNKDESQYELIKKYELTKNQFIELMKYAKKRNIIFLSTPYDEQSADMLSDLGILAFKIGSGEITHLPFIKHVALKNKPIILSTGASTIEEVCDALDTIESVGNKNIVLLHCTSNYPTLLKDVNLKAMATLRNEFGYPVGYSDHTQGNIVAISAAALGAIIIEKHLTLNRNMDGPDHQASIEPSEFKEFVDAIRKTETLLGSEAKKPSESEHETIQLGRRSLVAAEDISAHQIVTKDMIAVKRPGTGISPKYLERFVGKKTKKQVKKDSILTWDDITS